jgi:hypothetical protein
MSVTQNNCVWGDDEELVIEISQQCDGCLYRLPKYQLALLFMRHRFEEKSISYLFSKKTLAEDDCFF